MPSPKPLKTKWVMDPNTALPLDALCECVIIDSPVCRTRRFTIAGGIRGECCRTKFCTDKKTWGTVGRGPAMIAVEVLGESGGMVAVKLPDDQRVKVPIALLHKEPNSSDIGWRKEKVNADISSHLLAE